MFFIPSFAVLALLIYYKFKAKYLLPIGVFGAICFALTGIIYLTAHYSAANYKEILNYQIVSLKYEEQWVTQEIKTRIVTDSKGRSRTETYTEIETHGPYYRAWDQNGDQHRITAKVYDHWSTLWGATRTGTHYGITNGAIYESHWDGQLKNSFPFAITQTYTNKIRATDSVFKYKTVTDDVKKRFPRPADIDYTHAILPLNIYISPETHLTFDRINASLGTKQQIHIIYVLFDINKDPKTIVEDILNAWEGPNKNELVIFLGLNNYKIEHCEVHSWQDDTTLHAVLSQKLINIYFDENILPIVVENIQKYWHRKEFKDFNYLQITIHWIWYIIDVIICIITFYLIARKWRKE